MITFPQYVVFVKRSKKEGLQGDGFLETELFRKTWTELHKQWQNNVADYLQSLHVPSATTN